MAQVHPIPVLYGLCIFDRGYAARPGGYYHGRDRRTCGRPTHHYRPVGSGSERRLYAGSAISTSVRYHFTCKLFMIPMLLCSYSKYILESLVVSHFYVDPHSSPFLDSGLVSGSLGFKEGLYRICVV